MVLHMPSDLERIYKLPIWSMKPNEPEAIDRFNSLRELFTYLVEKHSFFKEVLGREVIHVIDVAAGSGIAGAALAHVLSGFGRRVKLLATDLREDDLFYVYEWLRGTENVDVETMVCDASILYKCLPQYRGSIDIALLWVI